MKGEAKMVRNVRHMSRISLIIINIKATIINHHNHTSDKEQNGKEKERKVDRVDRMFGGRINPSLEAERLLENHLFPILLLRRCTHFSLAVHLQQVLILADITRGHHPVGLFQKTAKAAVAAELLLVGCLQQALPRWSFPAAHFEIVFIARAAQRLDLKNCRLAADLLGGLEIDQEDIVER